MINKVISVCEKNNIKTWAIAAPSILKHIDSLGYEVIVPDDQIQDFLQVTPASISVVAESKYLGGRGLEWLRSMMPENQHQRAGWYLQQFIKIEACRAAQPYETCVIWDADTIPLKNIAFEDDLGRLLYYKGNHTPLIHEPYFVIIEKLLGISRLSEVSFISQSFPTRACWVQEMCAAIESKFNSESWIDAVVENIDFGGGISGFSEYETLGTFIANKHSTEYVITGRNFYRHGTALIGDPSAIHDSAWMGLKDCIDYIAFENYESSKIKGLSIGSGNAKSGTTPQGNLILNVDLEKYQEVDLIVNVERPWPFPNSIFEQIIANNILEHVDDILYVMSEIDRCLEVGGLLKIEVPFIGSYNHGTDVTHKRGLTYNAFNFLFADARNYLFREQSMRRFNYELVYFQRENIDKGALVNEYFNEIPSLGSYGDWIDKVRRFEIPGTFGFMFRKLS